MPWLRLIRWTNLLIIFLTQGVAWWCVVWPLQNQPRVNLLLTPVNFLLLSTSTMLIAAAGYIINDYFDIRIDAINKPDAVILEKTIPRRMAIIVHSCMNVLALLLAGIVAWQAGHLEWLLLQLACTAMLWRYSTTWKRQFVIGNVVVALMTALTIIALMIYEPAMHFTATAVPHTWSIGYPHLDQTLMPALVLEVFAFFAFLLSWMREVIKDLEDYQGDDAEGCITMPIKWGIKKSLRFVQILGGISVLLLAACGYTLHQAAMPLGSPFLLWMAIVVIIPLVAWIARAANWRSKTQFTAASRQLKWLMIAGILMLLFYQTIDQVIWDGFFVLPEKVK